MSRVNIVDMLNHSCAHTNLTRVKYMQVSDLVYDLVSNHIPAVVTPEGGKRK